MSDSNSSHEISSPDGQQRGPIPRPQFQLRSLPIPIRWEVTRRHPYYLTYWLSARRHVRREPIEHPVEQFLRPAACAVLATIGVMGEPVDPAIPFSDMGEEELHQAWLSGVVHPITSRGLAGLLLATLPKETLGQLGDIFVMAGSDDPDDGTPRKIEALQFLQQSDQIGLDGYVDEPIVSVTPAASRQQVSSAIGELLDTWKAERDLSERRNRSDKYPQYLAVWDAREGWTGSEYDLNAEQTFEEIAQSTGESPSTVSNHYRRSFELITGHSYSPGLWYRIMGWHKVNMIGFEESPVSRHRPSKSPTPVPVSESQLGADLDAMGAATPSSNDDVKGEWLDLMIDIQSLIQKGETDQKIIFTLKMEANPSSQWLIDYVRRRND